MKITIASTEKDAGRPSDEEEPSRRLDTPCQPADMPRASSPSAPSNNMQVLTDSDELLEDTFENEETPPQAPMLCASSLNTQQVLANDDEEIKDAFENEVDSSPQVPTPSDVANHYEPSLAEDYLPVASPVIETLSLKALAWIRRQREEQRQ